MLIRILEYKDQTINLNVAAIVRPFFINVRRTFLNTYCLLQYAGRLQQAYVGVTWFESLKTPLKRTYIEPVFPIIFRDQGSFSPSFYSWNYKTNGI